MTYPDVRGAADLTKDKLQTLLAAVDLEYLLDRKGALTEEVNWEDELSLGGKYKITPPFLVPCCCGSVFT